MDQTIERIYPLNSKRKTKSGEEYIYTNYRVMIPYRYLERMNITSKMFLYSKDNRIYATSVQPDGSVRAKKLSIHSQSKNDDKKQKWKRIFTIPKYFFPNVTEENKVLFSLDNSKIEQFSKVNATLTIDIIN